MSLYLLAIFQKLILSISLKGVVLHTQTHTTHTLSLSCSLICHMLNLILKVLSNATLPLRVPIYPMLTCQCLCSQSFLNRGTHLLKALISSPRSLSHIDLPKPQTAFSLWAASLQIPGGVTGGWRERKGWILGMDWDWEKDAYIRHDKDFTFAWNHVIRLAQGEEAEGGGAERN